MELLAKFCHYIAQSNVINFLLMVYILYKIYDKCNLNDKFDKAITKIKANIKNSEEEKDRTKAIFQESQKLLDEVPTEIENIKRSSTNKIQNFQNKIDENAQKSIQHLSNNAIKSIKIEEKRISNILTQEATTASIEIAKLKLQEMLKDNAELHTQFIQNSLDELDKVEL